MLKVIIAASLVGLAAAECPNACSGHGTCSKFDMCTCYSNWQGNDCSQRTCPFDLAHVDTPKGDLNGELGIETALVLEGSTVYPQGTYEGFPPNSVESAHYYMECSNKGICDRTTGECACFDGYEGTACQRASCPNDCSGHGTCETIEELSGDVAYKLWDRQATMGCKCDSGYGTADCSERECKYGVDPLYIDDTVGRYTQTSITLTGTGEFAIVFYDVHGEDYETAPIAHTFSTTPLVVEGATCMALQKALVALPNDVIKCDLAAVADADTNAQAILDSCVTCLKSGTASPVTYTLGFPNNPGYLRPLEIITNRPGVFSSSLTETTVGTVSIGEFVDHFATNCGVKVDILAGVFTLVDAAADSGKLKKCLGDSNRDSSIADNIEVYNWDLGADENPHVVKLVHSDADDNVVQFGFIKGVAASNDFLPLSAFEFDGDGATVFATDGVATYVRDESNSDAEASGEGVEGEYTIETAFDTSCEGPDKDDLTQCLSQGDNIFVFKAGDGPVHLYTIVSIATVVSEDGLNTPTYVIEVDYPLAVSDAALMVVHFEPAKDGSYEYVSPCSNRGTCDTASGLCQCFKGYTGDDCSVQSALAV